MRVVNFKALMKERGLRGYSRLNKAELIAFIQNNLQPCTKTPLIPPPRPIPASRPPPPAPHTRPPRPTRPPPQPPVRSRQPELRPYQLKPKRDKETFTRTSCRTVSHRAVPFFKPKTD